MGRPKSPDGRRNHENVMLSDAERDLIDSVRGDVKRGPWIRQAAVLVATGSAKQDSGIPEPARKSTGQRTAVPRCTHPGTRVTGGWCPKCEATVQPGGKLPDGWSPPGS